MFYYITTIISHIGNCKHNYNTVDAALIKQNEITKALRIDKAAKEAISKIELNRLSKTIKELSKVKSNDCKDVSNTIDVIRDYDFNSL